MSASGQGRRAAREGCGGQESGSLPKSEDEEALSKSKLGDPDDGGVAGQGGMRDPRKTSDADKTPDKPS